MVGKKMLLNHHRHRRVFLTGNESSASITADDYTHLCTAPAVETTSSSIAVMSVWGDSVQSSAAAAMLELVVFTGWPQFRKKKIQGLFKDLKLSFPDLFRRRFCQVTEVLVMTILESIQCFGIKRKPLGSTKK